MTAPPALSLFRFGRVTPPRVRARRLSVSATASCRVSATASCRRECDLVMPPRVWPTCAAVSSGARTRMSPARATFPAAEGTLAAGGRDVKAGSIFDSYSCFGWSTRPCESVPPSGGCRGGFPGSHGPSSSSSLGSKGCRKVNANGPCLRVSTDRSLGATGRSHPTVAWPAPWRRVQRLIAWTASRPTIVRPAPWRRLPGNPSDGARSTARSGRRSR